MIRFFKQLCFLFLLAFVFVSTARADGWRDDVRELYAKVNVLLERWQEDENAVVENPFPQTHYIIDIINRGIIIEDETIAKDLRRLKANYLGGVRDSNLQRHYDDVLESLAKYIKHDPQAGDWVLTGALPDFEKAVLIDYVEHINQCADALDMACRVRIAKLMCHLARGGCAPRGGLEVRPETTTNLKNDLQAAYRISNLTKLNFYLALQHLSDKNQAGFNRFADAITDVHLQENLHVLADFYFRHENTGQILGKIDRPDIVRRRIIREFSTHGCGAFDFLDAETEFRDADVKNIFGFIYARPVQKNALLTQIIRTSILYNCPVENKISLIKDQLVKEDLLFSLLAFADKIGRSDEMIDTLSGAEVVNPYLKYRLHWELKMRDIDVYEIFGGQKLTSLRRLNRAIKREVKSYDGLHSYFYSYMEIKMLHKILQANFVSHQVSMDVIHHAYKVYVDRERDLFKKIRHFAYLGEIYKDMGLFPEYRQSQRHILHDIVGPDLHRSLKKEVLIEFSQYMLEQGDYEVAEIQMLRFAESGKLLGPNEEDKYLADKFALTMAQKMIERGENKKAIHMLGYMFDKANAFPVLLGADVMPVSKIILN